MGQQNIKRDLKIGNVSSSLVEEPLVEKLSPIDKIENTWEITQVGTKDEVDGKKETNVSKKEAKQVFVVNGKQKENPNQKAEGNNGDRQFESKEEQISSQLEENVSKGTHQQKRKSNKKVEKIKSTVTDKKFLQGTVVGFVAGAVAGGFVTHKVVKRKHKKEEKKRLAREEKEQERMNKMQKNEEERRRKLEEERSKVDEEWRQHYQLEQERLLREVMEARRVATEAQSQAARAQMQANSAAYAAPVVPVAESLP